MIHSTDHPTLANGYLLLKGGELDEEMKELGRSHSVVAISDYFEDPFFETKKIVYIPV
jgi:16S rRNA (guanine527-N7)-methyltransferase